MADIHPQAICDTDDIGPGSRVEAFARVAAGARLGSGCVIASGAVVGEQVSIGDGVSVGAGSWIAPFATLEDDVVIGPNVTLAGGRGLSDSGAGSTAGVMVRAGAVIEAGATVMGAVTIGRGAVVEAGSVVSRSVTPHALVSGNPAEIRRNLDTDAGLLSVPISRTRSDPGTTELSVPGVTFSRLPEFADLRGSLTAGDMPSDLLPFMPQRWFVVYDVPVRELRGEHAHFECHQFLICVSGTIAVAVDDGERRTEVALDSPSLGLYVPPMIWSSQLWYEANSVLLVLASHPYDATDYIREYERFLAEVSSR